MTCPKASAEELSIVALNIADLNTPAVSHSCSNAPAGIAITSLNATEKSFLGIYHYMGNFGGNSIIETLKNPVAARFHSSYFNGRFMLKGAELHVTDATSSILANEPPYSTTTTLTTSGSPSELGETVTFTATVGPNTLFSPSGTVSFYDDDTAPATLLGTEELEIRDEVSTATLSISNLSAGTHTIYAVYNGDSTYLSSSSSLITQQVNPEPSITTIETSGSPSALGETVTFTATVSADILFFDPTGSVTFYDGNTTTPIGTGTLSTVNGITRATVSTSTLSIGSHSIFGIYSGDSNYLGSISPPITQQVGAATINLTTSGSPSALGQVVIFTAILTSNSPSVNPTGTVIFYDGGTLNPIGTGTLFTADGITSTEISTSGLALGLHDIFAIYSGDSNYPGSQSPTIFQEIVRFSTTTEIASSGSPSAVGESVTFTATVSSDTSLSAPTGSVTFYDNNSANPIGTGNLSTVGGVTTATLSVSNLSEGIHAVFAMYDGDDNFGISTSSPVTQQVIQTSTITTIAASGSPINYGQDVTFTATVNASTSIFPLSGSVAFYVDNVLAAQGNLSVVNNVGTATYTTDTLLAGSHIVYAAFQGNNFFPSSASTPIVQQVNQDATTTTLTTSLSPSPFGQTVTFTATLSSPPASRRPTGTVSFYSDGVFLGTGVVTTVGGVSGVTSATFSTADLSIGTHSIAALYSGDSNYLGSTSAPINQQVIQGATVTTVATSGSPAIYGEPVTFTATVAPNTATPPTGAVTFFDGSTGTNLGAGTLSTAGGITTATVSTSILTVGTHQIYATYNGDSIYPSSSSNPFDLTQQVDYIPTTTTIATSGSPSSYNQPITFTATVAASTSTSVPTGVVTFFDENGVIGTGNLSTGGSVSTATFTTARLPVGTHSISASYGGTETLSGSFSVEITQQVNQAETETIIRSNTTSTAVGQEVTFFVKVRSKTPSQPPMGIVSFFNGTEFLGNRTLDGSGKTTFSVSALAPGTYSNIFAVYMGSVFHLGSTSSPLTITIIDLYPPEDLNAAQFKCPIGLFNLITWKAPVSGDKPVAYRIYRDEKQKIKVGTVQAEPSITHYKFEEHVCRKSARYTYYIVSVDQFGNTSEAAKVTYANRN